MEATITLGQIILAVLHASFFAYTVLSVQDIKRRLRYIDERTILIEPPPGTTVLSMDNYRFARRSPQSSSTEFHA